MIEQITSDIETIVDTNNNSNKSFKNSLNRKKHTNSLIRLLGNKIKFRRRATSLNDLSFQFQSKFSSANNIKLADEQKSQSKLLVSCLNCQNRPTNSENLLLDLNRKASDLNYSRDCCHSCLLHSKHPYKIYKPKNGIKDTNSEMFENDSDQRVPVENKKKSIHTNDNLNNYKNNKAFKNSNRSSNEFENFNNLTFYKQCYIVTNWFKNMNDENKNSLLSMFLDNCGPSQNHLFSLKIVKPHSDCAPNCCDMISYLPKMITFQIFSYLDHISLANASQVNKLWHELSSDQLLWKRLCHLSKWRFSPASEAKQIEKFRTPNQSVNWKAVFAERFKVKKNWLTGKSFIKTFYGHEEAVSCVQFDDTRIVAGSAAGTIKVWNISESLSSSTSTMAQSAFMPYLNLFGHSGTIRCLHLDGQLNRLFSGSADHTIKVWDLSEVHPTWSRVTCKMTFLGHSDTVRCLQLNGSILISGSYDNTLKIWDLKNGKCTNTLRGHTDAVLCLQFDENKIISGSADRTIRVWNFEGNCLAQLEGHTGSVTCLHFDSQRIISGSLDFDIKFWRIDDGMCVNTLNWITKEGHTAAIRCLKADSQKIVSCSDDKTIKIWNIETGERYVTLKNHSDGVTCLQFNDYYILSGSFDRTIKLWDFSA